MKPHEMDHKVDVRKLHFRPVGSELDLEEGLVLDLASAIHRARSKMPAISWEAQVEAQDFYTKHGFEATLKRMLELCPGGTRSKHD